MGAYEYELIRGGENGIPDPSNNNKATFLKTTKEEEDDGFTDMELGSGAGAPLQIPPPPSTAAAALANAAVERIPPKRRLVSLDVFRGITVASLDPCNEWQPKPKWVLLLRSTDLAPTRTTEAFWFVFLISN